MSAVLEKRIASSYFNLMKNWDNEAKKELIIILTKSIDDNQKEKFDFSTCFNAWDDERSADKICSEIRNERKNIRETETF